jgi:hypothetical protein
MEIAIGVGALCVYYTFKDMRRFIKYRVRKKKLKKKLNKSFTNFNKEKVKTNITQLKDFDATYNTNKLEKYLEQVIIKHREYDESAIRKLPTDITQIDLIEINMDKIEDKYKFYLTKTEKESRRV